MMRRILFISCIIFFSSIPCQGLEVEFRTLSSVTTKSVTLADIADFSDSSELAKALGSQIIGQSPPPGSTITLDSRQIKKNLHTKLSLSPSIIWKGASKIQIERKGVKVGSNEILAFIDEFLKAHKDELPKAQIRFIPRTLPMPFTLPQGLLSVKVLPSSPSILGSTRFSLIFKVDGKVRKNMGVSGKIEALAPVVVATATIRKGTILHPKQIQMQLIDIVNLRSPCLSPRQILGKRAKRTIKAGSVIELSKVEFPPLIKKGQLVKIMLKAGDMFLSATGIARMNGKKNEIIRVQNSSSRKLIYCRVVAPGLVEIKL